MVEEKISEEIEGKVCEIRTFMYRLLPRLCELYYLF